jgi:hypothetical protein
MLLDAPRDTRPTGVLSPAADESPTNLKTALGSVKVGLGGVSGCG